MHCLQVFQMLFCVLEQVDDRFANVWIEKVVLEGGKGKEACPCHNVNAVDCATQANERGCHFPFRGRIEEGELLSLFDIAACHHHHLFRIEDHIRVA